MAKPRVLSIQALESKEVKSKKSASRYAKSAKLLTTNRHNTTPLKSESNTFLEYSANAMARRDGSSERKEVSMLELES